MHHLDRHLVWASLYRCKHVPGNCTEPWPRLQFRSNEGIKTMLCDAFQSEQEVPGFPDIKQDQMHAMVQGRVC